MLFDVLLAFGIFKFGIAKREQKNNEPCLTRVTTYRIASQIFASLSYVAAISQFSIPK
jgi:hypothetical protein